MPDQFYEKYWSFTNAFTDYNGKPFLDTLKICVDFIDKYKNEFYSDNKYIRLQTAVVNELAINFISARKAINQLVKMGFIDSFLISYTLDSLEYLRAQTNRKRRSILSKIIYSKSCFNGSVTNDSNLHQINFLINTLIENGKLDTEEIIALMLVDIGQVEKGYLDRNELDIYVKRAQQINFVKRKFNQISYLTNLLDKLDGIVFVNNQLYFNEDAKRLFGEHYNSSLKHRDPYLHLLYKNQLREESNCVFNKEKCMVEKLAYPILIASHIKPFIKSSDNEAYDPNNGLLISKNLDGLFDSGNISFNDDGTIIVSKKLDSDLTKHLKNYSIEKAFLTVARKRYLNFHRSFYGFQPNL